METQEPEIHVSGGVIKARVVSQRMAEADSMEVEEGEPQGVASNAWPHWQCAISRES